MEDDDQDHGKSWNINHYIFAGLCATLIIAVVITTASVLLSPAPVTFSVVRATRKSLTKSTTTTTSLLITIAVSNPSRRCQARYQSVSVSLFNSSTTAGVSYIYANVVPENIFPMKYVRGPNVTLITSGADLVEEEGNSPWADRLRSGGGLTVELTAQVRFKVGIPTRLYDMKVFCPNVSFSDAKSSSTANANFSCSG